MKFLVDECLSSELVTIARSRGHWESTHVTWLGLRSRKDWSIVRRAINDGYVLVTNNTTDFISLLRREKVHAGLVCFNVAHGLMSLNVQKRDPRRLLQEPQAMDAAQTGPCARGISHPAR